MHLHVTARGCFPLQSPSEGRLNMRRIFVAGCFLAGCMWVGRAHAQIPGLIDRPSPPPCAADGTCYPNKEVWGYYPGRWRTWPGVSGLPTPSTLEPTPADLGPELSPHETPRPEVEDRQAPPATTKRQPASLPVEAAEGGAESEPTPPQFTPPTPTGLPTSDADPPPAFPLSLTVQAGTFAPAATARSRTDASTRSTGDPPPAPPWNHRASL